jgi:CDP-glucose 4,6-dehydratase
VNSFWKNKRVFLTGHTGFKGGWLCCLLSKKGGQVHGYALEPPTEPNFFTVTNLHACLASSTIADIRDTASLTNAMQAARPDIVFHLAAQPLVRYSYTAPVETYAVNVMGTVNLLEAIRQTPEVKAVVNVTSDKCYENHEWLWPYRENDTLGGFDPYSSSKGCSELVTAAYRNSFLSPKGIHVASARAGNVIGGGDWAADRLVPDFFRAIDRDRRLIIRSPSATRPWQHVLEPLSGYLMLAQRLYTDGHGFSGAWNFGPDEADTKPVQWIVEYLCSNIPGITWHSDPSADFHEANTLRLDISRAKAHLGWRPRWNLHTALGMTLAWHQAWKEGCDMADISRRQIEDYETENG